MKNVSFEDVWDVLKESDTPMTPSQCEILDSLLAEIKNKNRKDGNDDDTSKNDK